MEKQRILPELPPDLKTTRVLVFALSHDKNYTFVWDGISKEYTNISWEDKHPDDMYSNTRPEKP